MLFKNQFRSRVSDGKEEEKHFADQKQTLLETQNITDKREGTKWISHRRDFHRATNPPVLKQTGQPEQDLWRIP